MSLSDIRFCEIEIPLYVASVHNKRTHIIRQLVASQVEKDLMETLFIQENYTHSHAYKGDEAECALSARQGTTLINARKGV